VWSPKIGSTASNMKPVAEKTQAPMAKYAFAPSSITLHPSDTDTPESDRSSTSIEVLG